MQVLTEREVQKVAFAPKHRLSKNQPVYAAMLSIRPGEGVLVQKAEWKGKGPPSPLCVKLSVEGKVFGYRTVEGGESYLIKRIR